MSEQTGFFKIATQPDIVKRSLVIAVIVGTVLNLINQGDVVMGSATFNLFKCLLTYAVPYCVSTYGAVTALQTFNKGSVRRGASSATE